MAGPEHHQHQFAGALALTPQGQQVAKFQMPLAHVNLLTVSDNGRWVAAAGEGRQLNLLT